MSKIQDDYIYDATSASGESATEASPYAIDEVAPNAGRLRATSLAVSGLLIAGGVFGAAAMTNSVIQTVAPRSAEAQTGADASGESGSGGSTGTQAEDAGFFGGVANFFNNAFL